jgi:hypothetical protein
MPDAEDLPGHHTPNPKLKLLLFCPFFERSTELTKRL